MPPSLVRYRRNQTVVNVTTAGVQIAGPNPERRKLLISSPAMLSASSPAVGAQGDNLDTSTIGVKLSYTVPAGVNATLTHLSWTLTAGAAPTIEWRLSRGGVVSTIQTGAANMLATPSLPLIPGDIVQLNVSVLGAASTVDAVIGVQLDPTSTRVTISFTGQAVLDQGINIYPGQLPLQLDNDVIGEAVTEAVFAVTALGTQTISVLDLFY